MKKIFFIFLIIGNYFLKAQNLVNNGNFELYWQRPPNYSQINLAYLWFAAGETPDYFNSCAPLYASVPNSFNGYQQDCCGGNGYVGIFVFNKAAPNNIREYIETELNDT